MTEFSIGIMAKAPVAGQAKTRLTGLLGAEGAARLQAELTRATLAMATQAAPGAVTLFSAGDTLHPFWEECSRRFGVPVIAQRGEDLGARMLHALTQLLSAHRRALLIGTDCPVLTPLHLQQAAAALDTARMAFIPAEDGGYVLVAAREIGADAFSGIQWGSDSVMQDTRERLQTMGWWRGQDWAELQPLWDIDRPDDLRRAQAAGLLAFPSAESGSVTRMSRT